MAVLENVKKLLGDLEGKDDLLNMIVSLTDDRLKTLLGVEEVPNELEYITTEVSVARFNKIGSEGISSHTVEGESMSFNNNDFEPYEDDIESWRFANQDKKVGRLRFL